MTRNIFGAGAFFGLLVMVAIQLLAGNMPYLNIAAATGVALLVGTYLGLDLMVAVSKTLELPKGKFKRIEVSKYIYALIVVVAYMLWIAIISKIYDTANDGAFAILSGVFFLIFSYWVAGRKATEMTKNKGPE